MSEILRVESIIKDYPGIRAVDSVSFSLNRGEILSLLGENGAGKSTLLQIVSGAREADAGKIFLDEDVCRFTSVRDGITAGISMVFQELSLSGNLSVAENIFAHRQPVSRLGLIDWPELRRRTTELLHRFALKISPDTRIRDLPIGKQQIVEILKAVSTDPKVLILDEPTSSLTEPEIEQLFHVLNKLREFRIGIIYTTHKLSEVFQIASRVVVLRDGKMVGERDIKTVDENQLVTLMVGRTIEDLYGRSRVKRRSDPYFRIDGFSRTGKFSNVSFELHRGEILGLAGLIGAGRTEVTRAICGIDKRDTGRVFLHGQEIDIRSPSDAIHNGIAYLTENRKTDGLFTTMSIRDNVVVPKFRRFSSRLGMVRKQLVDRFAQAVIRNHSVASRGVHQIVETLSGGNQQKVLLAEWLAIDPHVLIVDEPTRGVDVGARQEIYEKLREYVQSGFGIVLISSDLPEIIGLCDRVLVMYRGSVQGQFYRQAFTEERILKMAAGVSDPGSQEAK